MSKKDETPGTVTPQPQSAPQGTMKVRKGRYVGQYSRSFNSVPFGESMYCKPGTEHTVTEAFSYLWKDPQFDALWEWLGDSEDVPAVNPEQVKYS